MSDFNFSTPIRIVNCHAEGEVGDVIISGVGDIPGTTLWEQSCYPAQDTKLRNCVLREPGGGVFRHVNLLVKPLHPEAKIGVIIMEPEDTPPMSGSNSICVATVALETGLIPTMKRNFAFLPLLLALPACLQAAEDEIRPDEIQFRRQAVTRMVFDANQNIPLSSLRPARVVDLDLMHPEMLPSSGVKWEIKQGGLRGSSGSTAGSSLRWVGGCNPFATYDLVIEDARGDGSAGMTFRNASNADSLAVGLQFRDGRPESITWKVAVAGNQVSEERWPVPAGTEMKALALRAQMSAVGVNLLLESSGKSELIGYSDFSRHFDLRERERMQRTDFAINTELNAGAEILLAGASSCLSPGSGQADIRAITDEEGAPLLDDGRLWFTITVRGRALPHPLQGVFSLNPSVFDIRFEGIIVFDMDDGLLRNDLASHLFRDSKSGAWRGWTTGFSALGEAGKAQEKAILAITSVRDPRRGFSIMKARPIGLAGAHEDPHGIYDKEAGKWRLILCEHGKKYRAAIYESERWDGGFTRLAGPVDMDSTGTLIQKFGNKRFAIFGSADRKLYLRSYPGLEPAGELKVELPPWDDSHGSRIWPNVIPLPEGYPAPYIALMMDRVNFPGMPKANWTYGALYLYHGHPIKP